MSLALAAHPEDVAKLTVKGNAVAVVTDGSAVLGLGNLGPGAALPVMEGKCALVKRFAGIDAWPIGLDTPDTDELLHRSGPTAAVRAGAAGRAGPVRGRGARRPAEGGRRLRAPRGLAARIKAPGGVPRGPDGLR